MRCTSGCYLDQSGLDSDGGPLRTVVAKENRGRDGSIRG